jgi:hypothetical protein
MRADCRILFASRVASRSIATVAAVAVTAVAITAAGVASGDEGPGAAGAQEEALDPSLLDMQGLEALRELEAQLEKAEGREQSTDDVNTQAPTTAEMAAEAERKQNEARLEAMIGEQMKIQNELADRSKGDGRAGTESKTKLGDADSRTALGPPEERELPIAIFDREDASIAPGTWGNRSRLKVVKLTLDADGDGVPELTRWIDRESKLQIRREEDRNYDGVIDAWSDYEWGEVVARVLDSNDDGNPDVWERYEKARMSSREVDRDDDGVRDAFYRYDGDSLAEERHDSNNDGRIDLIILYHNRLRVSAEEDRDTDGQMDTWTTYIAVNGSEVVARIERDDLGEGTITIVEVFDTATGEAVILRKDEDINGDGQIDVVSIYESGKLVRREISDPSLVEL